MAGANVQDINCKTLINKVDYSRFPLQVEHEPLSRLSPRLHLLLCPIDS
ncbi:MAG: hypothetical protein Ct9H300mP11_26510 [Chloroflexota bacterium]|nr:MAG: hypothetical protein Ct9H300mP11_26510 [Chloroflexota bacterium]